MLNGKKIVVVFPAYNADQTLEKTVKDIDRQIVDGMILVDDKSTDNTTKVAERLGISTIIHRRNEGYGGNQKTCYRNALRSGAEVIVMVHPDYQYSPKLIASMAGMITSGHYDIAIGSRIIGNQTLLGGMPFYKYVANRLLTALQNILMGQKLSEYHTGFRAFNAEVLRALPFELYSDDFVFDNELLAQALYLGWRLGEISCPTRYFGEASSISFWRSCKYGIGVIRISCLCFLARIKVLGSPLFPIKPPRSWLREA